MLLLGDCNHWLKEIQDNSLDLLVTDPPYGIEFMGKDWDKVVVPTDTWKECYRILKEGKLAFVMCSPRQDVLARMIINLQDAGFRTNYSSIYWTYASGFPKAANVSKLIDKKNGAVREVIGHYSIPSDSAAGNAGKEYSDMPIEGNVYCDPHRDTRKAEITKPATEEAKKMEGAYVGFQPKPAVEVILVVSKGKTLTWLDDCRIPYNKETDEQPRIRQDKTKTTNNTATFGTLGNVTNAPYFDEKGRFPANLLCEDDVLNDGKITKSSPVGFKGDYRQWSINHGYRQQGTHKAPPKTNLIKDEGSYSRYFSLDSWWAKTFPFLIVPKAAKSERNKGLDSYLTVKLLSSEMDEWVRCQEGLTVVVQLLRKVTSGSAVVSFNIDESGANITAQFPKASLSTILTEINGIIESKILDLLMLSLTKGFTVDANSLMVSGGSPVVNVENLRNWLLIITKGSMELVLGVSRAVLKMLHKIRGNADRQESTNFHSTVKPIKLMSYLITMGSREGDLVLDPFCGSGTVLIAADQLHRKWLGIERNPEYAEIIKKRLMVPLSQLKLTLY